MSFKRDIDIWETSTAFYYIAPVCQQQIWKFLAPCFYSSFLQHSYKQVCVYMNSYGLLFFALVLLCFVNWHAKRGNCSSTFYQVFWLGNRQAWLWWTGAWTGGQGAWTCECAHLRTVGWVPVEREHSLTDFYSSRCGWGALHRALSVELALNRL